VSFEIAIIKLYNKIRRNIWIIDKIKNILRIDAGSGRYHIFCKKT